MKNDCIEAHSNLLFTCEQTLQLVQSRLAELKRERARLVETSAKLHQEMHRFLFRYECDKKHIQLVPEVGSLQRGVTEVNRGELTHSISFYTPKYESEPRHPQALLSASSGNDDGDDVHSNYNRRNPNILAGMPVRMRRLIHGASQQQRSQSTKNWVEYFCYRDADPFLHGNLSPPLFHDAQKVLEVQKLFPSPAMGNTRATVTWNANTNDTLLRLVCALGLRSFSKNGNNPSSPSSPDPQAAAMLAALESCKEMTSEEQWGFIADVLENMGSGLNTIIVPPPDTEQFWKTINMNATPLSVNEVTLHYMNTVERRHSLEDFSEGEKRCIVQCVTGGREADRFVGFTNQGALRKLQQVNPSLVAEVATKADEEGKPSSTNEEAIFGDDHNYDPVTTVANNNPRTKLVLNRGVNCWIAVAALLGTNRSGFSCLQQFQRNLRSSQLFFKGSTIPYSNHLSNVNLNSLIMKLIAKHFPSHITNKNNTLQPATTTTHPPRDISYSSIAVPSLVLAFNDEIIKSAFASNTSPTGLASVADVSKYLGMLDAYPIDHKYNPTTTAMVTYVCMAIYYDLALIDATKISAKERLDRVYSYVMEAASLLKKKYDEGNGDCGMDDEAGVMFYFGFVEGLASLSYPVLGYIINEVQFNVMEEFNLRQALEKDNLTADEARLYLSLPTIGKKRGPVASSTCGGVSSRRPSCRLHIDALPITTKRYLQKGFRLKRNHNLERTSVSNINGIVDGIIGRLQLGSK